MQSKNFGEGSGGRLKVGGPGGEASRKPSVSSIYRIILVVKPLLFYHHVSYRKHASVDRILQEVNIYEKRKYEV